MSRAPLFAAALLALLVAAPVSGAPGRGPSKPPPVGAVTIAESRGPVNRFRPDDAFGAALDGMGKGEVEQLYTPHNVERMRSAGLKRITYRTRAELGIEAWHWNTEGAWSDPAHAQGYWTSGEKPGPKPLRVTWGYNLPRRGDTIDQANNVGFSRLDDGDLKSFWKSNPYLDRRYTGLAENRPQWIALDLDGPHAIDTARIRWATPFAMRFEVQYWVGDQFDSNGRWVTFPEGRRTQAKASDAPIKLASKPVVTQFLRILLLRSSDNAPKGSTDVRDGLGYAVREVEFGALAPDGRLLDVIRHGKGRDRQTVVHVSSTDPWHRAVDRDAELEQPGFDLVYGSGLTNGLPMMVPVGLLYDTPENAAAEIRWLKAKGYPFTQVELGEEPDGQMVAPEDYADLYLETAAVLRGVDPGLQLGGPSLQSGFTDTWPDPGAGRSWTGRFIARLKARGGMGQLNFFSFEHYPFDDLCGPLDRKLVAQTGMMSELRSSFDRDGVPETIPWVISEYGFSAFSGRAMSELPSALLDADIVGHFLSIGGDAAYLFGYAPNTPINQHRACAGFGNMMLFDADENAQARNPMPAYWYARLLTDDWTQAGGGEHHVYAASSDVLDAQGRPLVTAYALRRPDGRWAVMLVNRDARAAHTMKLGLDGGRGLGALDVAQYSPERYSWKDAGPLSRPVRNEPPVRFGVEAGVAVVLPAYSLTVVTQH